MQRVRGGGRDGRIALRGRSRLVSECRIVVSVDDVVRNSGVIRLFRPERLENSARLQLIRVCLVRRRRGRSEGDRIEDQGLGIGRLSHRQVVHRVRVRDDARPLILVLEIIV